MHAPRGFWPTERPPDPEVNSNATEVMVKEWLHRAPDAGFKRSSGCLQSLVDNRRSVLRFAAGSFLVVALAIFPTLAARDAVLAA